jgi:hypothetical protein
LIICEIVFIIFQKLAVKYLARVSKKTSRQRKSCRETLGIAVKKEEHVVASYA